LIVNVSHSNMNRPWQKVKLPWALSKLRRLLASMWFGSSSA
jgi:hypothetical protein